MSSAGTPAVAIVGTDAGLAARPATPVQLAHACHRVGFDVVIPASWGDELVASECLRQLDRHESRPAILCSCPFVAQRLLAPGDELAPFFVSTVSPPVAAARYIRALYGSSPVHITFLGACPGAADPSIDARLLPDEFLATLEERGIRVVDEPTAFDSVIPPDRRRYLSLPGGAPLAERLTECSPPRAIFDIASKDATTELVDRLMLKRPELIDLSRSFGCACSGVARGIAPERARLATVAIEPPRAAHPIVEPDTVAVDVALPVDEQLARVGRVPSSGRTPSAAADAAPRGPAAPSDSRPTSDATPAPTPVAARRRPSPSGIQRAYKSTMPRTVSGEGKALPRAYVPRRRSTPTSVRAIARETSRPSPLPDESLVPDTRQAAEPVAPRHAVMRRALLATRVGLTPMLLGAAALLVLLVAILVLSASHSVDRLGGSRSTAATDPSRRPGVTTDSAAGQLDSESGGPPPRSTAPLRSPRHSGTHRARAPRPPAATSTDSVSASNAPPPAA